MSRIRRLFTAAAIALCAILPTAAMAAAVTFISHSTATSDSALANAYDAFVSASGGDIANRRGTLQYTSSQPADYYSKDIDGNGVVVVMTSIKTTGTDGNDRIAKQERLDLIEDIIKTNNNGQGAVFMVFVSDENPENITNITNSINASTGASFSSTAATAQSITAERNSNPAFHHPGFFPKQISGTQSTYFTNVSAANALYLTPNSTTSAGTTNEAYGVFVPHAQSNGGSGACVLFFTDTSMWKGGDANSREKLARDLIAGAQANCNTRPAVLYLSTTEWNGSDSTNTSLNPDGRERSGASFTQNARDEFKKQASAIDRAGVLSIDSQRGTASTFLLSRDGWGATGEWETKGKAQAEQDFNNLGPGDVVVVQTGYQLMDPDKAKFIASKIKTRHDLTFVLLLDTCNECSYNFDDKKVNNQNENLLAIMQPAINDALGWNIVPEKLPNSLNWTSELDKFSRSGYANSLLSTFPKLMGNTSGTLQCVPQANILFPSPTPQYASAGYRYSSNGYTSGWYCEQNNLYMAGYRFPSCNYPSTSPQDWPELNASSSFGMIVPFWQSNNGQGACIYLGQDNNPFDVARCKTLGQCSGLVGMFMSLPSGACNIDQQQATANASALGSCTGSTCMLTEAPAGTPEEHLAVLGTMGADGKTPLCKAQIWCNTREEDRTEYCAAGEDPSTHCCKAKPPRCAPTSPDCSSSSSPATSLPTLLGLGAMLPLLAARRRRRK